MKKIIAILALLFIGFCCYAEKVGEKIYYLNAPLSYRTTDTYLTKVEPVIGKDGYYNVEITTVISPAGSSSAVGLFTFSTHYTLKEKDSITLYKSDFYSTKATTLIVKKITNNEVDFASATDVLNEE